MRDHPTKVLIVDDSLIVLEAVQLTLEEAGFSVVTLDTPFEIHQVLHREQPDLALVDVNMPALRGDQAIEILRRSNKLTRCPIVLFSDRPVAELRDRARTCGADGYIQKTADPVALLREVRRFLPRRSRG